MSDLEKKPGAVIAIVKGGLGNQFFIYAAARALALRSGRRLYLDATRGYTHDTYGRSYRLNQFPIAAEPMPEMWRVGPTLKHPAHKLVRAFNKLLPRDQRSYLAEKHSSPATQLTALRLQRSRVTLLGYWQDEAYFADYAGMIRAELAPPAPADATNRELGAKIANEESVFLHIRRVRYATLLDAAYYQRAIESVRTKLKQPVFYVFGDDSAWAKGSLVFGDAHARFIEHNADDELADLWLMARCHHAIVANSSFSWWGGWLGQSYADDRLIMAPRDSGWSLGYPSAWELL